MVIFTNLGDRPPMTTEWSRVVKKLKMLKVCCVTYHSNWNFVLMHKMREKTYFSSPLKSEVWTPASFEAPNSVPWQHYFHPPNVFEISPEAQFEKFIAEKTSKKISREIKKRKNQSKSEKSTKIKRNKIWKVVTIFCVFSEYFWLKYFYILVLILNQK